VTGNSPYATADPGYRHLIPNPPFALPGPGDLYLTWCGRAAVAPDTPRTATPGQADAEGVCPECAAAFRSGTMPRTGVGAACEYCTAPAEHGGICMTCRVELHNQWRQNPLSHPALPGVLDLLRSRSAKGVRTYGRPLATHNGRDALEDLREELADALMYVEQLYRERADLECRDAPPCGDCKKRGAVEIVTLLPKTSEYVRSDTLLCRTCSDRYTPGEGHEVRRFRIGREVIR